MRVESVLYIHTWNDTLQNIWNKVKSKVTKAKSNDTNVESSNTPSPIELIDKNQPIAGTSNLSPIAEVSETGSSSSWIEDNAMDHFFKDNKGKSIDLTNLSQSEINRRIIEQSTGESSHKFEIESEELMSKMTHFIATHESALFPNIEIKKAIYNVIKTQMTVLYLNYRKFYIPWIVKPANDEVYNKFKSIESEIETSNVNEVQQVENYEDLSKVVAQEQEAWSDDANSSIHSPYLEQEAELPENQISMLAPFLEELEALPPTPNIVEQVAQEVEAEAPTSGINALLDAIKARRDDSNVIDDTNKEPIISSSSSESSSSLDHYLPESQNVENPEIKINSPEEVTPIIESQAESNKGILTPVLEAVKGLLTPKQETKPLEEVTPTVESQAESSKSRFINLFESIKSQRDDSNVVSSPKVSQLGLQTPIHERLDVTPKGSPLIKKPSLSNLLEDTNALFSDDDSVPLETTIEESENLISPVSIDWNSVTPNIIDGVKTEIDFKDIWRILDSIHFVTTDGHKISYSFEETHLGSLGSKTISFNLDDKSNISKSFPDSKILDIIIEDTSHQNHSIFKLNK